MSKGSREEIMEANIDMLFRISSEKGKRISDLEKLKEKSMCRTCEKFVDCKKIEKADNRCCIGYIPKDKPMEKKFMFDSEEQARDLFIELGRPLTAREFHHLNSNGYIRKSELQQRVDEAEEMITTWEESAHDLNDWDTRFIVKLIPAFQALKKDHPEFKI